MSKWKANERLRKGQYALTDVQDMLEFAIELAQQEGANDKIIEVMRHSLVKLNEIEDDLCWVQRQFSKAPPAGE